MAPTIERGTAYAAVGGGAREARMGFCEGVKGDCELAGAEETGPGLEFEEELGLEWGLALELGLPEPAPAPDAGFECGLALDPLRGAWDPSVS
jgi:hypothetical protein